MTASLEEKRTPARDTDALPDVGLSGYSDEDLRHYALQLAEERRDCEFGACWVLVDVARRCADRERSDRLKAVSEVGAMFDLNSQTAQRWVRVGRYVTPPLRAQFPDLPWRVFLVAAERSARDSRPREEAVASWLTRASDDQMGHTALRKAMDAELGAPEDEPEETVDLRFVLAEQILAKLAPHSMTSSPGFLRGLVLDVLAGYDVRKR